MFEAVGAAPTIERDVMVCHLDALALGRKDKFSRMKPEDVPDLTRRPAPEFWSHAPN